MLYGIDGWIIDVELLEKVSNGSYQDAMLLALNAWHHESAWKTVLCNFRTGSSYIQWVEAMRNGLSIAHHSGMPHDSLFKINRNHQKPSCVFQDILDFQIVCKKHVCAGLFFAWNKRRLSWND